MGAMASQITSLANVDSSVYSATDEKTSKLRVTGLCVGNSPVTCEFPAQMASNAENFSIWWRHHAFHVPKDKPNTTSVKMLSCYHTMLSNPAPCHFEGNASTLCCHWEPAKGRVEPLIATLGGSCVPSHVFIWNGQYTLHVNLMKIYTLLRWANGGLSWQGVQPKSYYIANKIRQRFSKIWVTFLVW